MHYWLTLALQTTVSRHALECHATTWQTSNWPFLRDGWSNKNLMYQCWRNVQHFAFLSVYCLPGTTQSVKLRRKCHFESHKPLCHPLWFCWDAIFSPSCFSASFLFSRCSSIPLCSPCAQSEAGVATVSLMSNPLTLGEHCIAALMQGWILECGAWREAYRIRKKEKGKRKKELRRERSQNHTWDRRKKRGLGDNIRLHWRVRRIKLQSSLLNVCWDKKSLIWMEVVQVQAHCGMQ